MLLGGGAGCSSDSGGTKAPDLVNVLVQAAGAMEVDLLAPPDGGMLSRCSLSRTISSMKLPLGLAANTSAPWTCSTATRLGGRECGRKRICG